MSSLYQLLYLNFCRNKYICSYIFRNTINNRYKTYLLQFYQDTLEIEDDKEQREKENSEEDLKKDKDLTMDDDKDNRDDDDGSNSECINLLSGSEFLLKMFLLKNAFVHRDNHIQIV